MDSNYIPVLIFFVAVPILWAVSTYNRFVKYRNMIEEAWSGIDVALKRRFNLIPNVVRTVRLYNQHEANTLENVTEQRIGSTEDLKASQNFLALQHGLNEVEKEIAVARQRFNGAVRKLNTLVQSFPSNFIARIFNFREAQYFSLELATERGVPDVTQH